MRAYHRGVEAADSAGDEAAAAPVTRTVTPIWRSSLCQDKQRRYGAPDRGRDRRSGTMNGLAPRLIAPHGP